MPEYSGIGCDPAEAYFLAEFMPAIGGKTRVSETRLRQLVLEKLGKVKGFARMRKKQLFHLLAEALGRDAYGLFPVGIPAGAFQKKFQLTRVQVGKLVRLGVIQRTGQGRLRDGSEYGLYNVWDYFHLTQERIEEALRASQ